MKAENDPASLRTAARIAYDNLFHQNLQHLGHGDCYIVIVVYGPPDASGTMPEYAYVFTRNSNHWRTRNQITRPELAAIEAALGNEPL